MLVRREAGEYRVRLAPVEPPDSQVRPVDLVPREPRDSVDLQ